MKLGWGAGVNMILLSQTGMVCSQNNDNQSYKITFMTLMALEADEVLH